MYILLKLGSKTRSQEEKFLVRYIRDDGGYIFVSFILQWGKYLNPDSLVFAHRLIILWNKRSI